MGKQHVSAESFVLACKEVFQAGGGYDEVSEKLGIAAQSVVQRAAAYRKLGINLPRPTNQRRGRPAVDKDALNAILAE